jgi:aspartate/methionine/tyrosine aminotransferase
MKTLDLSYGHPTFLEPYWKDFKYDIPDNLSFEYQFGVDDALLRSISLLHKQEKNATVDGKYIVVGNGATQVLTAIIAVLKLPVYAHPPHFMRFPNIANIAGVPFKKTPHCLNIITLPNNPDNRITINYKSNINLFDLSYNWPQYTNPVNYNEDIMVFSLSKATGHASSRIGWALFTDKNLADKVKQYIEYNTSGVSIEAQHKAVHIINSQLGIENTCFLYGRKVLLRRWKQLLDLGIDSLNKDGMFLFGFSTNAKQLFRDVLFSSGKLFGVSDMCYRINVGCSNKQFLELKRRIHVI